MKIQPVDCHTPEEFQPVKPVVKSRLKQLFEWQFPNVLRISAAKKVGVEEPHFNKESCNGSSAEFEPSSLCLSKMVQNFIEENNEKQSGAIKCGRNRCNCFNRKCTDSSEDDLDFYNDSNFSFSTEALEFLKGLVPCASVWERNLLAETAKIVEKNKICKRKDEFCRNVVTDGLLAMGYDASVCKSRWEKSPSHPSGQYEYIDVIMGGERYLIDIDFRSEFEIARSTKSYKAILQSLPYIFVGKTDRLQKIIGIVSEAAKQSLKKKGMHIPPWRKEEYVKAKWLSPHPRCLPTPKAMTPEPMVSIRTSNGELGGSGGEGQSADEIDLGESVFAMGESGGEEDEKSTVVEEWKPPEVKPKGPLVGVRIVTGLASVIEQD